MIGAALDNNYRLVITLSDGNIIQLEQSLLGAAGAQGEKGDKGDTGAQGEKGDAGADGRGILSVTLTNDFRLVFHYTDGTSSVPTDPIRGAQGEKGEQGATGAAGADGRGITTVSLADGNLYVTYSDSTAPTLIGYVKGEKGDKGDTGAAGAQGEKGAQGSAGVDGKSAYELYKAAYPDYTGTLTEWLASLKGDTGRGIQKTEIVDGKLIVTYTDGTTEELQLPTTADTSCLTFQRLENGTLEVSINANYKTLVEDLAIPSSFYGMQVTAIADKGFEDCSYLKHITLPSTITSIGTSAFYKCTALESINIPDYVTSIGTSAFDSCTSLKAIVIPNSVTFLGNAAFSGCSALMDVRLSSSLQTIESTTFARCTSLASITLPDTLVTIGASAFEGCNNLSEVGMSRSVVTIGQYAFHRCTALQSITIPNSVTEIGMCAFKDSGLVEAYFESHLLWNRYCKKIEGITYDGITLWGKDCSFSQPDTAAALLKEVYRNSYDVIIGYIWKRADL